MHTHVQKWGNSLAVRIPLAISRQMNLHVNSLIEMEMEGNCLMIRIPHYNLDEMLSQVNSDNLHSQSFDDEQIGNEEW